MEKNGRAVVALLILIMGVLLSTFDLLLHYNCNNISAYSEWIIIPLGLFLMARALDGKLRTSFYVLTVLQIACEIISYSVHYYLESVQTVHADQISKILDVNSWLWLGAFLLGYGIWFFSSKKK